MKARAATTAARLIITHGGHRLEDRLESRALVNDGERHDEAVRNDPSRIGPTANRATNSRRCNQEPLDRGQALIRPCIDARPAWIRAADRQIGRKPIPKDGSKRQSQIRRSEIEARRSCLETAGHDDAPLGLVDMVVPTTIEAVARHLARRGSDPSHPTKVSPQGPCDLLTGLRLIRGARCAAGG